MESDEAELPKPRIISGFWRRSLAYILDSFTLGVIGQLLGLVMFDFLVQLGGWGRLLGFGVALLYFGFLNSALGSGQTIGKRLLRIEVVDKDGNYLSLARSFLRSGILSAPFFLNGAQLPSSLLLSPVAYLLVVLVFGLGGAILYLYTFNRPTRQSVHDLVVGSYVVKVTPEGEISPAPVWKVHLLVCGTFLLLMIAGTFLISQLARKSLLADLLVVQESIQALGKTHSASVFVGTMWSGGTTTTYVESTAWWKKRPNDQEAAAREIATIILEKYPEAMNKDRLQIVIAHGYDIGIASVWRRYKANHSPREWEEK